MDDDAAPDPDSLVDSEATVLVSTPSLASTPSRDTRPSALSTGAADGSVEIAGASLGAAGKALLGLLHLLPKNALSRLAGRIASLALPPALQEAEIKLFARLAGVNLSEARDPISRFATLQQFFTRALADGCRPIEGDADTLVSPCDGAWGASGRIEEGTILQVKGRSYAVADLLGDAKCAARFEGGQYATFYLSPRDYHRFHTPTAGRITRTDYWPGSLWPVNPIGLQGIDGLFAKNERICAYLSPDFALDPDSDLAPDSALAPSASSGGAGPGIALVAVGATMVGSVRLTFTDLTTNVAGAGAARNVYFAEEADASQAGGGAPRFARGEEWGHFEFGSTIVMLLPPGTCDLDASPVGTPLRLGTKIGRLKRGDVFASSSDD